MNFFHCQEESNFNLFNVGFWLYTAIQNILKKATTSLSLCSLQLLTWWPAKHTRRRRKRSRRDLAKAKPRRRRIRVVEEAVAVPKLEEARK